MGAPAHFQECSQSSLIPNLTHLCGKLLSSQSFSGLLSEFNKQLPHRQLQKFISTPAGHSLPTNLGLLAEPDHLCPGQPSELFCHPMGCIHALSKDLNSSLGEDPPSSQVLFLAYSPSSLVVFFRVLSCSPL